MHPHSRVHNHRGLHGHHRYRYRHHRPMTPFPFLIVPFLIIIIFGFTSFPAIILLIIGLIVIINHSNHSNHSNPASSRQQSTQRNSPNYSHISSPITNKTLIKSYNSHPQSIEGVDLTRNQNLKFYCAACGMKLDDDMKANLKKTGYVYCSHCGNKIFN